MFCPIFPRVHIWQKASSSNTTSPESSWVSTPIIIFRDKKIQYSNALMINRPGFLAFRQTIFRPFIGAFEILIFCLENHSMVSFSSLLVSMLQMSTHFFWKFLHLLSVTWKTNSLQQMLEFTKWMESTKYHMKWSTVSSEIVDIHLQTF